MRLENKKNNEQEGNYNYVMPKEKKRNMIMKKVKGKLWR